MGEPNEMKRSHIGATMFLESEISETDSIDLIILNVSLDFLDLKIMKRLWERARIKVCADGAGNRLYNFGCKNNCLLDFVPTVIIGDLDSISAENREFYSKIGVEIVKVNDQNSTDFEKSVRYISEKQTDDTNESASFTDIKSGHGAEVCNVQASGRLKKIPIVVLGDNSGRLDHTLHNLKVLLNNCKNQTIKLISQKCLTFALPKGSNVIQLDKSCDGPTCGILPLAGECVLTTKGLFWDMKEQISSVTGLLSSSNIVDDSTVYIENSEDVIWTCEYKFL